ncbi:hypothetical protein ACT3HK_13650 [Thermolongibacillus altinsuensis]
MKHETKEKMKTWLLIVMIITLVGSFVLFFLGYYMTAFVVGGIFMFLAIFLGQWYSFKNADYLYGIKDKNRR